MRGDHFLALFPFSSSGSKKPHREDIFGFDCDVVLVAGGFCEEKQKK